MINAFERQYFENLSTPRAGYSGKVISVARIPSHASQIAERMGWHWSPDSRGYAFPCPFCCETIRYDAEVIEGGRYDPEGLYRRTIEEFLLHTRACPPRERGDNIILGSE